MKDMFDYNCYYKEEPSEIDIFIENTITKIKNEIGFQADNEVKVKSKNQSVAEIQEEFNAFKKKALIMEKGYKETIKRLQGEIKTLKEKYNARERVNVTIK